MIKPHGGTLINRMATKEEKIYWEGKFNELKKIAVDDFIVNDINMIADGAMSPLKGFMGKDDYDSVIENTRLKNGLVWSIPIVFGVETSITKQLKEGEDVALVNNNELLAILHLDEIYRGDKRREVISVYGTDDENHPGVKNVYLRGDSLLGGNITVLKVKMNEYFRQYYKSPTELRAIFKERGFKTVVAFQTRNPIHRAHEYLQKCALEIFDGLLIHPLVGETKGDDIPADVRMRCYEALLKNYYPQERIVFSVFPANMRYAGPKEAIFHALCRKNYGCTHIIIGRDHAGVGNYYGTYDAQKIFDNFSKEELDIEPVKFENSFFCKKCGNLASFKTCPHDPVHHLSLSGTKVREMLSQGLDLPLEFTRKEVSEILKAYYCRK